MKKDNRILFDAGLYKGKTNEEVTIEGFKLTEEEKKSFPNLLSLDNAHLSLLVTSASDCYTLTLSLTGFALVKDSHNGEKRQLKLDDSVDITLDLLARENTDILPDEDGNYDLRGSILALLFDAIPDTYSEVKLTKIVTKDYTLYSEEEYEKEKKAKNNPFAVLDDND